MTTPSKKKKHSTSEGPQLKLVKTQNQKLELSQMGDYLKKKILENPEFARKAATIISLWLNKKSQKEKE